MSLLRRPAPVSDPPRRGRQLSAAITRFAIPHVDRTRAAAASARRPDASPSPDPVTGTTPDRGAQRWCWPVVTPAQMMHRQVVGRENRKNQRPVEIIRSAAHARGEDVASHGCRTAGESCARSARRQSPHALDVQRQAHQMPLASHLLHPALNSESQHLLDPAVRCLRDPLARRTEPGPRHWPTSRPCDGWPGESVHWPPLAPCPRAPVPHAIALAPAPPSPPRCSSPRQRAPHPVRPRSSLTSSSNGSIWPWSLACASTSVATMNWCASSTSVCAL